MRRRFEACGKFRPLTRGDNLFGRAIHNIVAHRAIQWNVEWHDPEALPVSTLTPPTFAPEQVELFREVLQILNEQNLPYAVAGAFALQHHTAIWRTTKDLDLFLPAEQVPAAITHLERVGLTCDVLDPAWLAKARRGNYFVDLITGMSNGIIRVDRSWIERSSPTTVFDVKTCVLAAEELLASKLFVQFRERYDGADMVHVIYATRGNLDWPRILSLVGEHYELLLSILVLFHYIYPACGSYVPDEVWNTLLGKLQGSLARPEPTTSFRGTLLDEKMFAVDVNEWGLPNPLAENRAKNARSIDSYSVPPRKENENRRAS
jgi:hypothetical protein